MANSGSVSIVERLAKPALIGAGVGAIGAAAILAVCAALMSSGVIPTSVAGIAAVCALALGSFAGGFVSAMISGENGMVCGALAGAVMFLLAWAAGGIIGVGDAGVGAVIRLAEAVAPAAIGGVFGVNSHRFPKI